MVAPSAGTVVLVPFPFSDLSNSKLRPAVVLADAGKGDWILCQVTSNAYADSHAVMLRETDFQEGGLKRISFVRPGKLFTASADLMVAQAGVLQVAMLGEIIDAVVGVLRGK